MVRTALSALRANLSNLLMNGWIETKSPCSEGKCTRELLLKDQNTFISLCCRWFRFYVRFLYGKILFHESRGWKTEKNRKSPGVCPGGRGW